MFAKNGNVSGQTMPAKMTITLRDAVAGLSEREKRILALRFEGGRTQMEVAGQIGISQAQVSRLEKSAIRSIRKAILPS